MRGRGGNEHCFTIQDRDVRGGREISLGKHLSSSRDDPECVMNSADGRNKFMLKSQRERGLRKAAKFCCCFRYGRAGNEARRQRKSGAEIK